MTVYGSEPRKGMHPAVLGLVGLAVLAVLGAGVWVLTSGSDEQSAAAVSTPASSAPAPRPSASAAPAKLTTGSWLLSPAGDPDLFLTVVDEFAALSPDERLVLNVSKGLADDACFSFREPGGKYLRHFDYRLRFDTADDSDLFREDATFCPVAGAAAGTVRLKSKNYPDHLLHRRGTELYIDAPGDSDDGADFVEESSFTLQKA